MFDTIIIGGGPAGVSAAIYAARKKLNSLLITENIGGQILETWEIENYPGFSDTTGAKLAQKFTEHLQKFAVTTKNEKVIDIRKTTSTHFVVKTITEEYEAKTLILAMGKKPRPLNVPGEKEFQGKGVTYCATCDGPLFADKIVAIVGSGNSGLEAIIQMEKTANQVYLIEKESKCAGDPLLLDKIKAQAKTQILNNTEIMEIYGDNFVRGVKIKDSKTDAIKNLKIDGVFVEIGSVPSTELIKDLLELNKEGKIKIDRFCQTSQKGIFACGDITDIPYEQIVIAAGEGAKAAISTFNYLAKMR
ncbi:MAG: FAD-dependent oxidoreductase [Patescibacteria group bacterium]|nr:FAD-dependent oxidoreductase [Patescibacteria group bacterium]